MMARTLADFLRDNAASKSAQAHYRRRAADLSELAHDQLEADCPLQARVTRYRAFIVANAARAEFFDPEPPR